ncbi:hypothetical protein IQ07DRAFT_584828 [Pyrenochaeta sp. DS3sAY3a]|nr:hypothetical protein IQ07DRAFT_584828 [Pyrenochaeta sp. DS3sAY3a]
MSPAIASAGVAHAMASCSLPAANESLTLSSTAMLVWSIGPFVFLAAGVLPRSF